MGGAESTQPPATLPLKYQNVLDNLNETIVMKHNKKIIDLCYLVSSVLTSILGNFPMLHYSKNSWLT